MDEKGIVLFDKNRDPHFLGDREPQWNTEMRDELRVERAVSAHAEENTAASAPAEGPEPAQRADDASRSGWQYPAAASSWGQFPTSSADSSWSWTNPAEVHADQGAGYGGPVAARTNEAQSVDSTPGFSSDTPASALAGVGTVQGPYDGVKVAETESPQPEARLHRASPPQDSCGFIRRRSHPTPLFQSLPLWPAPNAKKRASTARPSARKRVASPGLHQYQ